MRNNDGKLLLSLSLILGLVLLGCRSGNNPGNEQLKLSLDVDPGPPRVGPSHLTVAITDADGRPLDGAKVKVEGTMAMHNMQPLLATLSGTEGGRYEAPFTWTMGGDWTMSLVATLPGGRELTREFDVAVAKEGSESMGEHDHETTGRPKRIPNEGAVIRLLAPGPDQSFRAGEDVKVKVGFENFTLAEGGSHWHVYVDGHSAQMVMGGMDGVVLRDLPPGIHEIAVYLSIGSHQELEAGASTMINVEE